MFSVYCKCISVEPYDEVGRAFFFPSFLLSINPKLKLQVPIV